MSIYNKNFRCPLRELCKALMLDVRLHKRNDYNSKSLNAIFGDLFKIKDLIYSRQLKELENRTDLVMYLGNAYYSAADHELRAEINRLYTLVKAVVASKNRFRFRHTKH